jgi:hypothetical protein
MNRSHWFSQNSIFALAILAASFLLTPLATGQTGTSGTIVGTLATPAGRSLRMQKCSSSTWRPTLLRRKGPTPPANTHFQM